MGGIIMSSDKKSSLQYESHIVAFIDILGFAESVDESCKDSSAFEKINYVSIYLIPEEETFVWDF